MTLALTLTLTQVSTPLDRTLTLTGELAKLLQLPMPVHAAPTAVVPAAAAVRRSVGGGGVSVSSSGEYGRSTVMGLTRRSVAFSDGTASSAGMEEQVCVCVVTWTEPAAFLPTR